MRRRFWLMGALIGLMSPLAVACTAPPKPTVSLTWRPPTSAGVMSGQNATYSFKAANFPAGSTVSLQRLQGGKWTFVSTAFAAKSGNGTTRPPLGRDHYRLVLQNFSGVTLASASQILDVYDNFPFSTIFSIPRKHLDGFHSFDYDFRTAVALHNSSCVGYTLIVHNESATREVLDLVYTPLGQKHSLGDETFIDRAAGQTVFANDLEPGTDWSITAEGADLYIEGTGRCFTSNGQM